MNRTELLDAIRQICYNEEDIFTLDEWQSLTVPELRTVVALLDDGGAEMIASASPRTRTSTRGNCFLLEGLARWIRSNPTNPRTRRPITDRQRALVASAYFRMTGQQLQFRSNTQPNASSFRMPRIPVVPRTSIRPVPLPHLHIPHPRNPNEIPDTEPRAPRVQSANTRFFSSSSRGAATTLHLNGRTIVNLNGQRSQTLNNATLVITRSTAGGRDVYTINIQDLGH